MTGLFPFHWAKKDPQSARFAGSCQRPTACGKTLPISTEGNGVDRSGMIDGQKFFVQFNIDEFGDACPIGQGTTSGDKVAGIRTKCDRMNTILMINLGNLFARYRFENSRRAIV